MFCWVVFCFLPFFDVVRTHSLTLLPIHNFFARFGNLLSWRENWMPIQYLYSVDMATHLFYSILVSIFFDSRDTYIYAHNHLLNMHPKRNKNNQIDDSIQMNVQTNKSSCFFQHQSFWLSNTLCTLEKGRNLTRKIINETKLNEGKIEQQKTFAMIWEFDIGQLSFGKKWITKRHNRTPTKI